MSYNGIAITSNMEEMSAYYKKPSYDGITITSGVAQMSVPNSRNWVIEV
jgi:hypothetical protein